MSFDFAKFARSWVALAVVAALQVLVLGSMVWDRIGLLRTGREIVLPIVPVDPRDLFKGDYVTLAYPISTVPAATIEGDALQDNRAFYVTLEKQADETWKPVKTTLLRPPAEANANRVVLEGRSRWGRININKLTGNVAVRYGIERYYVPEGKGLALEKMARDSKLAAIVAVDGKGRAAIKGLMVDGKKVYDEPLL